MFAFILGLIDPISRIATAILDAKKVVVNAKTEQEKIAAEERVKTLEARKDVLVAESATTRANVWVRTFIALPVGILFWKVYVYDKAFGQWTGGRTDALSPELWNVIMVVVGFYFLYEIGSSVARIFKP